MIIGFDPFAFESHARLDYDGLVQGYLFPLSEEIDIYTSEQESVLRVNDGKIDILGNMYISFPDQRFRNYVFDFSRSLPVFTWKWMEGNVQAGLVTFEVYMDQEKISGRAEEAQIPGEGE